MDIDTLVEMAEGLGLNVLDLCEILTIPHDRTNNGGLREIIALGLEDDDALWIAEAMNKYRR